MPVDLVARAEALATRQHGSVSSIVIQCVEGHVANLERMYGLQPAEIDRPASTSAPARITSTNPLKVAESFTDGTGPYVSVLSAEDAKYDVETDSFFRLFVSKTWPKFAVAA
jgi:hypothetical protein